MSYCIIISNGYDKISNEGDDKNNDAYNSQ